jgi:CRP/FNR family transcriptional regulator
MGAISTDHNEPSATQLKSPAEVGAGQAELFSCYPFLQRIQHPVWLDILARSRAMSIPAGTTLMRTGEPCQQFTFILEGQVRVFQHGEDGREVTLYHSGTGDICVKTLSSLLHSKPFRANAVAFTDVRLISLTQDDFEAAMACSPEFRTWVMTSVTDSFCNMLETFHGTVFHRLEMRMACLLGSLFEREQTSVLRVTHQELAQELGSTREVVSRILKHLERQGCIRLSRGQIEITDSAKFPRPSY